MHALAQTLSQLPLFARLSPPHLDHLAAAAVERVFAPEERVVVAGTPATTLVILRQGYVKLLVPDGPDGSAVTIDVIGPDRVVGIGAITGLSPHPMTAQALDQVTALLIPGPEIRAIFQEEMEVVFTMLGTVSGALRGLLGQVNELKLKTTAQRLGMFFLHLANGDIRNGNLSDPVTLSLPYSKRIAAEKLGMTPESLSRALAKLEGIGVLQAGRTRLTVSDPEALMAYCGLQPGDSLEVP